MDERTVQIPLTQGQIALVDETDWPLVSKYKWYAVFKQNSRTFYAGTKITLYDGRRRIMFMHSLLMQPPNGLTVDHVNHVGTDNRRSNMRLATRSQQKANSRGYRNNTTGFVGVYRSRVWGLYDATVPVDGRNELIGTFDTAEEAAHARDIRAREIWGEFARLNFPTPEEAARPAPSALVPVTQRTNRSDNSSGYRGVTKGKLTSLGQRWIAQIQARNLGSFGTPEEAARAYDAAAREAFGAEARLNFPE